MTTDPSRRRGNDGGPPQVSTVLTQGRKDLWNGEPMYLTGFLLNPLRSFVVDPSFAIAGVLAPPLTNIVSDAKLSTFFTWCWVKPLHVLYPISQTTNSDFGSVAKNEFRAIQSVPTKFRKPSSMSSALRGAFAFSVSVCADLVGALLDGKKMQKWFQALTEFRGYLQLSGIGDELEESIMKPLWRGRLLDNCKILNDIQELDLNQRLESVKQYSRNELEPEIQEGHRMMRFATAAYGTEMIKSALDRDASAQQVQDSKEAIAFHCSIQPQDLLLLEVDDGGSMKVLRHFVAVDHSCKQVVLALRGTLSISGALVDMQGMDCDYCCGKAHKGIAEVANAIWDHSGTKIVDIMNQFQDYTLVITGHSLGAGAACLLNLKCHTENLLSAGSKVRCFGFAPPPTYCASAAAQDDKNSNKKDPKVQQAMENCICYIHDNDVVPHLSVLSIRRLALLMDTVDNETEHMWAFTRFKIFWEYTSIPQELVHKVQAVAKKSVVQPSNKNSSKDDDSSMVCHGASKLIIPCSKVVWMNHEQDGSFNAIGCLPEALANINIFMGPDMISDHMPEQYEDALDDLCQRVQQDE